MNWKSLFTKRILERGEDYYYDGCVDNVVWHSNGIISADVYGSDVYDVEIYTDYDKSILDMTCSCPYAEDGKLCKHEAAVLFAVENGDFITKETSEKLLSGKSDKNSKAENVPGSEASLVNPFTRNDDNGEYHYFDMESITKGLLIYNDELQKARDMIDNGELEINSFNLSYMYGNGFSESLTARVSVVGKASLKGSIDMLFSSEKLFQIDCYIRGCNQYEYYSYSQRKKDKGLCSHKIAALLLVQRYINENNPGDSTDSAAQKLIKNLRIKRPIISATSGEAAEERTIKIFPQISFSSDSVSLFFKIGIDKAFVLKNVHPLIEAVNNSGTLPLGKTEILNFASDSFDENSQKVYQFIENTVRDLSSRSDSRNYYRYYDTETITNQIQLYGNRLDDFFDIARDIQVELRNEYKSRTTGICKFKDGTINPCIEIEAFYNSRKEFEGIKAHGKIPTYIKGAAFCYVFKDDALIRLSQECTGKLNRLSLISTYGRIEFTVGRKKLADFYRNVLPLLRDMSEVKIKDQDVIETYLPPLPEYEFFLDAPLRVPSCSAVVKYGDAEFNMIDHVFSSPDSLIRDLSSEKDVLEIVKKFFPLPDIPSQSFAAGEEDDKLFELLSSGINTLLEIGTVNVTDRFKSLQKIRKPSLSVGVKIESGLLDLYISAEGISNDELLNILASYKLKKKYHRISSGEFISIDETVEELSSVMEALDISPKEFISGKMHLPMYRALYLEAMSGSKANIELKRDQYFRSLMKDFKTVNDADYELPESLDNVLRAYQRDGFKWLKTIDHYGFGGILADDMGLGKTLQIISLLLSAKEENGSLSAIVVCPASLVYNWYEEIMRFAPQLDCCTITGSTAERADLIKKYPCPDVMISSYDLLKRDIAEYSDKNFDYVIIDEAQFIKNHNTAAAKSVKIINGKHRFALTGTPIENRLSELWSIFDFLMPGFLYSYESFKKKYELPISKNDNNASTQLSRIVSPFIMRRLKGDVLKDLPEKLEELRYAKFDSEQQTLYDAQVLKIRNTVEGSDEASFNKSKIAILAEITKARQICCDPSLIFENYNGGSAKRDACMDLIKSAIDGNHRILLFSQFTSMLSLLEDSLNYEGIEYYKLTGSTSKEERMRLVKDFNSGNTPVFLISLKAGGTGLNLTGADIVIHYDPWWNVAAQNQATDRAHRIGQTKTVSVYRLIAKDSIEEKILNIQERKKNLADSIISADINGLASMTKEDLMELFS